MPYTKRLVTSNKGNFLLVIDCKSKGIYIILFFELPINCLKRQLSNIIEILYQNYDHELYDVYRYS